VLYFFCFLILYYVTLNPQIFKKCLDVPLISSFIPEKFANFSLGLKLSRRKKRDQVNHLQKFYLKTSQYAQRSVNKLPPKQKSNVFNKILIVPKSLYISVYEFFRSKPLVQNVLFLVICAVLMRYFFLFFYFFIDLIFLLFYNVV
jgi:hypothetical protein